MKHTAIIDHISQWLSNYCTEAGMAGYIVGISGGIDSALTSVLCARTGKQVLAVTMPIRQTAAESERANEHISWLKAHFPNVSAQTVDLTEVFETMERTLDVAVSAHHLAMANTRARLRMSTLYALGQVNHLLVAGTGNKIEDFGVGFFTKYGDGGVDVSPIADLTKSQVFQLAGELNIVSSIQSAKPTDGLWEDGRSDEDQIGATYPELEWAMSFSGDESGLSERQHTVLDIFRRLHRINRHKMDPIPVCLIPANLKTA